MPRWPITLFLACAACAEGPPSGPETSAWPSPGATADARGRPHPVPRPAAGSRFIGATPEGLRAALGEPLLRRHEGPAEIWLYTGGGCQLDVVFYGSEAAARVAHIQARAGGIHQRSEASCLRDISAQAAAGPSPSPDAPPAEAPPAGVPPAGVPPMDAPIQGPAPTSPGPIPPLPVSPPPAVQVPAGARADIEA